MTESVPVRCPACRREHRFTAPRYPCACGTPVTLSLDPTVPPVPVVHRSWEDEWVPVACPSCGRRSEWPRPELGCLCGAVLRIAVALPEQGGPGTASARGTGPSSDRSPSAPSGGRGAFRTVPIRTARDAVTVAALYLRWLGHDDVRRADQRPPSGIGLAARGVVAQVDPAARPASSRDVECLWLTAMTESADCVYFSLNGYTAEARSRADGLGVPPCSSSRRRETPCR
ncbi:hypothetical protein GCM10020256_13200 [Streptomyces thermocoprophilus]